MLARANTIQIINDQHRSFVFNKNNNTKRILILVSLTIYLHNVCHKQLNFQYEDSPHQQNKLQILIPNDVR